MPSRPFRLARLVRLAHSCCFVSLVPFAFLLFALTAPLLRGQASDPGSAQSGGPPGEGRGPRGGPPTPAQELQRLKEALTLTEGQQAAILPILEKRQTLLQQLMASSADRAANREQARSIMESTDTEIKAQLTEAQQAIFLRMHGGPRGGGPPGGSPTSGGSQDGPGSEGGPPPEPKQ